MPREDKQLLAFVGTFVFICLAIISLINVYGVWYGIFFRNRYWQPRMGSD